MNFPTLSLTRDAAQAASVPASWVKMAVAPALVPSLSRREIAILRPYGHRFSVKALVKK